MHSEAEIDRASAAVKFAGQGRPSSRRRPKARREIAIGPMHLAKGHEFPAVAVMACDDGILPLQARIEAIADEADLEEVFNTERHLLYVACTRAPGFRLKKNFGSPLVLIYQEDSLGLRFENHHQRGARWWHRGCSISSMRRICRAMGSPLLPVLRCIST